MPQVLACPGVSKGTVRVELYDLRKSQLIAAHESELAAMAINQQGTRLATASDKGAALAHARVLPFCAKFERLALAPFNETSAPHLVSLSRLLFPVQAL